jgi:hypothetical protein
VTSQPVLAALTLIRLGYPAFVPRPAADDWRGWRFTALRTVWAALQGASFATLAPMSTALTYALEGRSVSSSEFFERIAGGGRQAAVQQMIAAVESVSCPEHGGGASVAEVEQTPEGFGLTISGCCDPLIDRAHQSAAS